MTVSALGGIQDRQASESPASQILRSPPGLPPVIGHTKVPLYNKIMMPGSKGLNPHELAHRWVKDLGGRPDMSIKVGCISHDMRILGRIVGVQSTEQSAGIIVGVF